MTRRQGLQAGLGLLIPGSLLAREPFWTRRPADKWTSDEIDQLLNRSPWAKEVVLRVRGNISSVPADGPVRSELGMSYQGIPGLGGPGMGGGGMQIPGIGRIPGLGGRGGGSRGERQPEVKAVVRWESARPIREAVRQERPEAAKQYLISVSGLPPFVPDVGKQDKIGEFEEALRNVARLSVGGRRILKPVSAEQQVTTGPGAVMFAWDRSSAPIEAGEGVVTFSARIGSADVRAEFVLKEMFYQGRLEL